MSKIIKTAKKLLNDDKGFIIAIVVALVILTFLMVNYYFVNRPLPEGYNTISLLDSQNKAVNYPELVVLNQNSTFTVNVNVENHMGQTEQYRVLLKTAQNIESLPVNSPPVDTYEKTLGDGQKWSMPSTVTLSSTGNFSVVFELYMYDSAANLYKFDSYNLCVLNVQVVNS
jgi:uncharacterized membrane protein